MKIKRINCSTNFGSDQKESSTLPVFQVIHRRPLAPFEDINNNTVDMTNLEQNNKGSSVHHDREYLQYPILKQNPRPPRVNGLIQRNPSSASRQRTPHGVGQRQRTLPDLRKVIPEYEDHLATLPLAAEIKALRRIQSSENVDKRFGPPPNINSIRSQQQQQMVANDNSYPQPVQVRRMREFVFVLISSSFMSLSTEASKCERTNDVHGTRGAIHHLQYHRETCQPSWRRSNHFSNHQK